MVWLLKRTVFHLNTETGFLGLDIFYFNLVRCTYKYIYIQVTECKRIRTKAEVYEKVMERTVSHLSTETGFPQQI